MRSGRVRSSSRHFCTSGPSLITLRLPCAGERLPTTPVQHLRAQTAASTAAALEQALEATGIYTVLRGYADMPGLEWRLAEETR